MPNYYNQPTDQERHFTSLNASAEIAEKASLIALERDWDIEKATNYVRKMNPNLAEMEKHGYVSEQEAHSYTMPSLDAAAEIAEKTKKLMRAKKLPYDIANTRVIADPENAELVKAYAFSD